MKETLSKQDIKLEWEDRRSSGNSSPQVTRMSEEQTSGSPQSVITTRRYTRTITATGHITETIANPEPDSPESNSHMQQVIQQQQQQIHVKNENSDQQRYQDEMQHHPDHVPISPHGSPNNQQHGGDQQPVIFAISNGQELQVEPIEPSETRKEPPR